MFYTTIRDREFLKFLNAPPMKSCGRSNPRVFVLFGLSDCISRAEYLIANQEIRVRFPAVANMPRANLRRRVSKTHQAQGSTEAACHF